MTGLLLVLFMQVPSELSVRDRTTIEVANWSFTRDLGSGEWEWTADYRINGGEWYKAHDFGDGGTANVNLPGTSVWYVVWLPNRIFMSVEMTHESHERVIYIKPPAPPES